MLLQSDLKRVLHYSPESGIFSRVPENTKPNRKKVVGTLVNGYLEIRIGGNRYLAHRLAWLYMTGEWPTEIDHINRNKTDNRFSNLRNVTHQENCRNRKQSERSLVGVYEKGCRWIAAIKNKGKTEYLGTFKTKEEASIKFKERRNELWSV